jgi:2-polyprenyl-3-methyl-5-hydroxy-6-metoxy-1,4-benzoquinol methylase
VTEQTETPAHTAVERLSPRTNDYTEILYHWQRYLLAGRLAAGKRVLDVASGEGYGADHLAAFAERVCGVDLDALAVKQALAKYRRPNLSFQQGSADRLPFAAGTFDLVTSFETIEHLVPEDHERFVAEVTRVLEPGGLLLISTPNKRRTEKFAEKNPYHLKEFYPEEFTSLLRRHFKHVTCWVQEINLAVFSWSPDREFPRGAPWISIRWNDGLYQPSGGAMGDFLYVVALCSDQPAATVSDLDSVCFDVTRTPLESMWHDHLTQIDDLKRRAAEKVQELRRAAEKVQELEAHVKRGETALAAARFEARTILTEREALIGRLTHELAEIRGSRSWKLVEGYQHMMDRSRVGRILRPIRNRVFRRPS